MLAKLSNLDTFILGICVSLFFVLGISIYHETTLLELKISLMFALLASYVVFSYETKRIWAILMLLVIFVLTVLTYSIQF